MSKVKFQASANRSGIQRTVKNDWDAKGAYREVVDNSITSGIYEEFDSIEVRFCKDGDDLAVIDTSGGVLSDDFSDFFVYGQSGLGETEGGISEFGSGLSASSYVFSDGKFRVISNRYDSDCGTTVMETDFSRVSAEEHPEVIELDSQDEDFEEVPPGTTKIVFIDGWSVVDSSDIQKTIGRIYNRFLDSSIDSMIELDCFVEGEKVEPVNPYEFSYSPFLPPREYPRIKLTGEFVVGETDVDGDVYVDIITALLSNEESEELAGTDIYCQDILVGEQLQGERGGFTSELEWSGEEFSIFRGFSTRRSRFKPILRFYTDASDKSVLPWNSSKNKVIINGYWVEAMVKWARHICESYRQGYDPIRSAHIIPFTADHTSAVNEGKTIQYDDYDSGEKKLRHGEKTVWNTGDGGLRNELQKFNSIIEKHERHQIYNPDEVINLDCFADCVSEEKRCNAYEEVLVRTAESGSQGVLSGDDFDISDFEEVQTNSVEKENLPTGPHNSSGNDSMGEQQSHSSVNGSEIAVNGFKNERVVMEELLNYKDSDMGSSLMQSMGYNLFHIESVEVSNLSNSNKPDLEVCVNTVNGSSTEYISIKKVKNANYNQLEKRWVTDYVDLYSWSKEALEGLKMYVGRDGYTPNELGYTDVKDERRFYFNELPEDHQDAIENELTNSCEEFIRDCFAGRTTPKSEWVLVTGVNETEEITEYSMNTVESCLQDFDMEFSMSSKGNIHIGDFTLQRKGGDNGEESAQMLQVKFNPAILL